MPSVEVIAFIAVALLAGGLTMGGVTLVYFLDKWRVEPPAPPAHQAAAARRASPFDEAA